MKKLIIAFLMAVITGTAALSQQTAPAPPPSPTASPSPVAPSPTPVVSSSPGKRPPQAKTQAEYADYNSAYALTGGAAVEKAADDFVARYPQSELRPYLYSKAMHEYQTENNPARMLAMGEKVLALDPDDSIALVLTATVLADSLSDADLDRAGKIAEIRKNSLHALQTIDTSFIPPPNATPDQVTAYKNTLESMAHSAMGVMELKTGDDAAAESDLSLAADLNKTQPDPYIWYHLALAQEHLATAAQSKQQQKKKYNEALTSVNLAVQFSGSNPDLQKLAQSEHDRLIQQLAEAGRPAPKAQSKDSSSRPPQ